MRVVIQRVIKASVEVDKKIVGSINQGMLLFVGFTNDDTIKDIEYIINKIIHLRIFDDQFGKMNLSLNDIKGSLLSISQFTLYANVNNGRRPSFEKALSYNEAEYLYASFNKMLKEHDIMVEEGIFGANMKIELINDGPVTIIIDSRECE